MRLLRLGPPGAERPHVQTGAETVVDVSGLAGDFDRSFFAAGGLDRLAAGLAGAPSRALRPSERVGPPVARPGKVVCIGLNYADHAAESGLEEPAEPVVFFKDPGTVVGPRDDVLLPVGGDKTDWEVELAVVIGRRARYLPDPAAARAHIAGYSVSNDVSERAFQLERGGQWVKGKSCETFNPLGPWLVTTDECPDPGALGLWLDVNGERMQDSSTERMIFDVDHIVWYLSRFMVLEPGDVINTGTPAGVGLGRTPPRYLRAGDVMTLGIDGLGEQRQECRPAAHEPGVATPCSADPAGRR